MIQLNSSLNVNFTQILPDDIFYGILCILARFPSWECLKSEVPYTFCKKVLEPTHLGIPISSCFSLAPRCWWLFQEPTCKTGRWVAFSLSLISSPWLRSSGRCFMHIFPHSKLLPAVHGETLQVGRNPACLKLQNSCKHFSIPSTGGCSAHLNRGRWSHRIFYHRSHN